MLKFTLYLELIKESRESNLASLLNYIKMKKKCPSFCKTDTCYEPVQDCAYFCERESR